MTPQTLKILYVGTTFFGTCGSRREALERLGYVVIPLNIIDYLPRRSFLTRLQSKFSWGPSIANLNHDLIQLADSCSPDWVWIDKGIYIFTETVRHLRFQGVFVVHHLTDDFMYNKRQFRHYLSGAKYYNAHLSIHPFHKHELRSLKASNWVRTHLGFDPSICCPPFILKSAPKYSTDVIFVGHWEEHTEEHVSFLIDQGVNIKVWGMNWKKCRYKRHLSDHYRMEWIPDSEYAQAISSSKIALCFLSKCNRNQETGRSYEIPAIGTFMLGERTEDHLRLYEEGHEAEFFESSDELLEKIQFYLANETDRERIATFGKRRALTSGYTYFDRIKADLANLLPLYSSFRDSHL